MALSLVSAPATEPVSLADAKLQLRVDSAYTADDTLITALIVAARELVETFTHRALITQTWDQKRDGFPSWQLAAPWAPIVLPLPPTQSITSVTYIDFNGVTQTWSPTLYDTDLPSGPKASNARVLPGYQQIYPVTREVPNAVVVRFIAGYGDAAANVPRSLIAAMQLLIGNWYENREAGAIVRGSADILPFGVEQLLWPYKVFAEAA